MLKLEELGLGLEVKLENGVDVKIEEGRMVLVVVFVIDCKELMRRRFVVERNMV